MISQLIRKSKYYHLKLIHQHPNGIQNRFKNTADKWVQSLNYPKIQTYYQFFKNIQTRQHDMPLPMTQIQQNQIKSQQIAYKPGLAQLKDLFVFRNQKRPDDYQISQQGNNMNFKKFIQQGKKNFSIPHKLFAYGVGFILFHIIVYFKFYYDKQIPKTQRVKVLNAQILEIYNFQRQQQDVKLILQRINIFNDQYQKQLNLAIKQK